MHTLDRSSRCLETTCRQIGQARLRVLATTLTSSYRFLAHCGFLYARIHHFLRFPVLGLTPCSSGCDILRSPPLHASPVKSTSAALPCGWLPTPAQATMGNDIYMLVCPCIIQESDVLLSPKTSLPVTGNLATEIFSGPVFFAACELNRRQAAFLPASDSVPRCFCKGRALAFSH